MINEIISIDELEKVSGGYMASFVPIPKDRKIKFDEDKTDNKKNYKTPEELYKEVPPLNVVPIIPIPNEQVKV